MPTSTGKILHGEFVGLPELLSCCLMIYEQIDSHLSSRSLPENESIQHNLDFNIGGKFIKSQLLHISHKRMADIRSRFITITLLLLTDAMVNILVVLLVGVVLMLLHAAFMKMDDLFFDEELGVGGLLGSLGSSAGSFFLCFLHLCYLLLELCRGPEYFSSLSIRFVRDWMMEKWFYKCSRKCLKVHQVWISANYSA